MIYTPMTAVNQSTFIIEPLKRYMRTVQKILLFYMLVLGYEANAQNEQLLTNLRGYWKFNIGDNMDWSDPAYNVDEWTEIYVPAAWEDEGFHGYDGYAWYRRDFEFTQTLSENDNIFIDLGYIDDVDEVYFNGTKIGLSGNFPPKFHTAFKSRRVYHIPNSLIKNNAINTIAVRVYDVVLDGGIVSGNIGIYRNNVDRVDYKTLDGLWAFKSGWDSDWRALFYDDNNWDKVMVPGFWASYKGISKKNICTYRRKFEIPDHLQDYDDLVIVLGRIDDFDMTFLNGKFIGETNDGGRYMSSWSFREIRVYDLPKNVLNKYGTNVITVEVKDIGGHAGIYEGPIAIVPRSQVDRFIDHFE